MRKKKRLAAGIAAAALAALSLTAFDSRLATRFYSVETPLSAPVTLAVLADRRLRRQGGAVGYRVIRKL